MSVPRGCGVGERWAERRCDALGAVESRGRQLRAWREGAGVRVMSVLIARQRTDQRTEDHGCVWGRGRAYRERRRGRGWRCAPAMGPRPQRAPRWRGICATCPWRGAGLPQMVARLLRARGDPLGGTRRRVWCLVRGQARPGCTDVVGCRSFEQQREPASGPRRNLLPKSLPRPRDGARVGRARHRRSAARVNPSTQCTATIQTALRSSPPARDSPACSSAARWRVNASRARGRAGRGGRAGGHVQSPLLAPCARRPL